MRIQMIAVGSTGDVQPMIVLGKELAHRGHTVCITAFSALQPLVESAGLLFNPLPGDAAQYIGSIIQPGANPFTYLSRLEKCLQSVAGPFFEGMYTACLGMDAVVATFFGTTIYSIAEKLNIPLFQTSYCLTDTTGEHCLPIMKQPPLGRGFNRMTYKLAYQMIGMVEKRYVSRFSAENGIPVRNMAGGPNYQIRGNTVQVLYAFSGKIVKRPPEWPENLRITGFWEDISPDFVPGDSLRAFLQNGEVPIYIGFGSMTSGDMGKALSTVLDALSRTGMRALISSGWGGMDAASLPDNVCVVQEYVPHDWLFQQVRAVVHHGGAGTTAAGLRAGKPSLAVPFGSDQYFWGDRIHELGCGPMSLPRTKLTANRLADALIDLVSTPAYVSNAHRIQQQLLTENGPAAAADIIETHIAGWKK